MKNRLLLTLFLLGNISLFSQDLTTYFEKSNFKELHATILH